MAKTISTKLMIEGEAEYRRALANCNSEIGKLKSSLQAVSSEYRNNANTMQALSAKGEELAKLYNAQKTKVSELEKAVDNARKAQEEYIATMEDSEDSDEKKQATLDELTKNVNKWEKQLNTAKVELNKLDDQVTVNNQYLDEAKKSTDGCATSIDKYGKEVKDTGKNVGTAGKQINDAAKQVDEFGDQAKEAGEESKQFGEKSEKAMDAFAAVLVAGGIQKGLSEIKDLLMDCLASAQTFEAGMAEVFTLLPNATGEAREQMSADMLAFSGDMNVLTTDAVPALYQAISAGVPSENVFDFLTTAQKAAKGGVTELETAVDGLTSVTNAYGSANISAQRASDIMFTTVKLGKTNFEQLSSSLYNVVPTAVSAGVSFENIGAALAAMTAQGVPTAQSTTKLRQMLVELTDTGGQVDKTFREIAGRSFKEFVSEGNNVQDALQLLEEYAAESNLGIDELFSSVEAGSSALLLTGEATDKFSAALAEMENSAGATEAAYKTMADTAEEKSKRLENATANLQIAIGDALIPAIGGLQDAGSGVLEWATEFAEKNQWLVQVIAGLVTGFALLAAGITAYTVVAKLAKLVTEDFNKALEKNPTMLVVMAIIALGGAIAGLVLSMQDGSEEIEKYTEASRNLQETLDESTQKQEDSLRATEENAAMAEIYIGRLAELEEQILSAAESDEEAAAAKQEYATIVDLLNETIPGLNAVIDEQTGLVEGGTEALTANTEAWIENEKAKVYQETFADVIRAQAEAEAEQAANMAELNSVQAEKNAKIERYNELQAELAKAQQELDLSYDQSREKQEELMATRDAYAEQSAQMQDDIELLTEKENYLNAALVENDSALQSTSEQVEIAKQAYADLTQKSNETAEAQQGVGDKIPELNGKLDSLQTELEELKDQYDKAKETARQSIESQMGLFEKMTVKVDTSVTDMIESLKSQMEYMDNYAANMKKAMEMGIDEGLLQKLSDGSTESAAILQAIVDDGGEHIDELNQTFLRTEQGKDDFSGILAEGATNFHDRMEEIREEMNETVGELDQYSKAASASNNTMQGAIDATYDKVDSLRSAFAYAARQASNAYNANLNLRNVGSGRIDGSYAKGLSYVPFDGFVAELHKGERVLTAEEAKQYLQLRPPQGWNGSDRPVMQTQQQTGPTAAEIAQAVKNALGEFAVILDAEKVGAFAVEQVTKEIYA